MKKQLLIVAELLGTLLMTQPSDATLIDRGNGLLYDTVLNITWTQDAGLASSVNPAGSDKWTPFVTWAGALVYGGFDDWRLASMDIDGDATIVDCSTASETNCRDNEYGYMYFYNLAGIGGTGDQTTADGVTLNAIAREYRWGNFDYFSFALGMNTQGQISRAIAWAVRDGDSVQIPEPSSLSLFTLAFAFCALARLRSRKGRRPIHGRSKFHA